MNHYSLLIADAARELWSQKLRTLLTLLGMIFGVGAVIAMLNIGEGAQNEALKLIDSMGVRNILLEGRDYNKEELAEIREESLGLNMGDIQAARATLPFVEGYSASRKVDIDALYSDFAKSTAQVLGVTPSYYSLANLTLAQGSFTLDKHEQQMAQVAVLGADAAEELFPQGQAIGSYIKVNHLWLQIVGVLTRPTANKEEFQGVKIGGDRYRVFIPLATAANKLPRATLASELDSIKLAIAKSQDPAIAAKAVQQLMRLRHGDVDDYQMIIPAALLEQQKQTQQIFNIVMACVAGISLLVGGIGIMNIMLANVMERTKEIGLLRAVGATQDNIKQQFLAESFTISLIGGLLGIVFGLVLSEVIGFYSGWAVSWSLPAIIVSMGICMLVGVGFGVFPAIKASKLNPIEALHSD